MKKIFLILCFGLIPFMGIAQYEDNNYYCGFKVMAATNLFASDDYSKIYDGTSKLVSAYIRGEYPIVEKFYFTPEASLGFGVIGDKQHTPISFGVGFKTYPNNYCYISMMTYPRLHVADNERQINGDYSVGWITFVSTVGVKYKFDEHNLIFSEVGVTTDLTIYSTLNKYKNNFGALFTIGYSYKIR